MSYETQLEKKLSEINESFVKNKLSFTCEKIIPSPKTTHYRNKMDFVINYQGLMGLREKGKWWKTIDNHKCFLAEELIEKVFDITYAWLKQANLSYYDRKSFTGFLRYAVIRSTKQGEVMLILVTSAPIAEEKEKVLKEFQKLAENKEISTLVWSINNTNNDLSYGEELITISGNGFVTEDINGLKYKITPNAFFQTNSWTAEILQNTLLDFADDVTDKTVFDGYCGSGFFSLALAKSAKKVVGVEEVNQAVEDAKENAKLNSLDNVEFFTEDVRHFYWKKYEPDLVVLDPSRAGLHPNVIKVILHNLPKEIIYVSCNFKNFAKEMVELSKKYKVENTVAIDMFPHTPHVELVTKLVLV